MSHIQRTAPPSSGGGGGEEYKAGSGLEESGSKPVTFAISSADRTILAEALQKANNLSDVASASTARTNLSVFSKAQVEALLAAYVLLTGSAEQTITGGGTAEIRITPEGIFLVTPEGGPGINLEGAVFFPAGKVATIPALEVSNVMSYGIPIFPTTPASKPVWNPLPASITVMTPWLQLLPTSGHLTASRKYEGIQSSGKGLPEGTEITILNTIPLTTEAGKQFTVTLVSESENAEVAEKEARLRLKEAEVVIKPGGFIKLRVYKGEWWQVG